MTSRFLFVCFYLLFFLTPLVWYPYSSELFEYNKMMFVYLLTVLIAGKWIIMMIQQQKILIKRTPLDIPLLLFLAANILSTIFSIDVHTSIWGYYSRSNGGLLSTLSYIILYYAFVSNFDRNSMSRLLHGMFYGGLITALYAIPEHFGVSPSCLILKGEFSDSCWVQDVQARVFATLGQPNWLAAYMEMLIFPVLYFGFTAEKISRKVLYFGLAFLYYLAFTFTYSRGATFGFIAGVAILIAGLFYFKKINRLLVGVLAGVLIINILFGSALTSFRLVSKFAPPSRPAVTLNTSVGTQLENGGTESGQIRLIVWQGALDIFKHYPIFGSGVETFGYAYYNYRPVAHNMVSEWEFLYNKAHNEFLNYLSTTGIVGFGTYMGLIGLFIYWAIKQALKPKAKFENRLLITAILASYIAYLIQNFFGFSVVIIAFFFYIFPAFIFVEQDNLKDLSIKTIHLNKVARRVAVTGVVLAVLFCTLRILEYWMADRLYAEGMSYNEAGNPIKAYYSLVDAVNLNHREPLYLSELGFAEAGVAVTQADQDATTSAVFTKEAVQDIQSSVTISPKNVSLWRTAVRAYYLLATINPKYFDDTINALNQAITLAPTDPKLPYNKGLVLEQEEASNSAIKQEALESLEKAVQLKPNYPDALYALGIAYFDNGQKDKAIAEMKQVLILIPGHPQASAKIKEWSEQ